MAKLSSPNGYIEVTEPGLYEIVSVLDVQCPGTVLLEAATFRVHWVPKPSARLSPRHETVYERYNRTHILPPICEGADEHVDLELTGIFFVCLDMFP
jgi:nucleoporin POM152